MDFLTILERFGLPIIALIMLSKYILQLRQDSIDDRIRCDEKIESMRKYNTGERAEMLKQFYKQHEEAVAAIEKLTDAIKNWSKDQ